MNVQITHKLWVEYRYRWQIKLDVNYKTEKRRRMGKKPMTSALKELLIKFFGPDVDIIRVEMGSTIVHFTTLNLRPLPILSQLNFFLPFEHKKGKTATVLSIKMDTPDGKSIPPFTIKDQEEMKKLYIKERKKQIRKFLPDSEDWIERVSEIEYKPKELLSPEEDTILAGLESIIQSNHPVPRYARRPPDEWKMHLEDRGLIIHSIYDKPHYESKEEGDPVATLSTSEEQAEDQDLPKDEIEAIIALIQQGEMSISQVHTSVRRQIQRQQVTTLVTH